MLLFVVLVLTYLYQLTDELLSIRMEKATCQAARYLEFEFKEGKVVNARANKNEEFLISQLNLDSGSRYLGEFAIGTNYRIQRFTKSILYDEKIGG
ncbi:MAG: hypothetical protein B6242_10975, partial [Anaerolineaceae bacterium 4572_78]